MTKAEKKARQLEYSRRHHQRKRRALRLAGLTARGTPFRHAARFHPLPPEARVQHDEPTPVERCWQEFRASLDLRVPEVCLKLDRGTE